jgi:EAL domain-containing protein (putative c-di-GMP-specific phosphodiesterase class I)
VTAGDIGKPRFIKSFLDMVGESGFPRQRLTVEITESGLMADLASAGRILGQLRTAGCRVAIDDFGTGYSSLAWLKALPADYLKLDSGLTGEISGSDRDRVVIRAVISMARSLGLSVIAEGVETEAQRDALAREGCSLYQGFLCSRPVDEAGLLGLV